MTWSARRRLVAFAASLTLAMGLLAGLLLQMVFPIDYSQSLLEARFGWTVALALLAVLLCLYVALPVAAAAVFARENGHPLAYGGVAVAAILMPVLTPLAVAWGLERTSGAPILPRLVGAAAALVAALGGGALAAERVGPPNRKTRWVFVLNIAVLGVFSAGFLGAQVAVPGFADRHTTDTQPDVDLEFEEQTTDDGRLLVVEHAGGEPAPVDRLDIRGEGFADVEAADQTEPGPWAGEATGRAPRGGGPAVVEGDTVTVGVADDCGFIIGTGPELRGAVEYYDCSES
ncbi:hypothetical protein BRD14_00705 [Halobacteriales archaeon SW_5_68_122]|nr:MAG: hypothetical protein BRD14_00705 [Halobacteriales archaeon SW_5_68_122]